MTLEQGIEKFIGLGGEFFRTPSGHLRTRPSGTLTSELRDLFQNHRSELERLYPIEPTSADHYPAEIPFPCRSPRPNGDTHCRAWKTLQESGREPLTKFEKLTSKEALKLPSSCGDCDIAVAYHKSILMQEEEAQKLRRKIAKDKANRSAWEATHREEDEE